MSVVYGATFAISIASEVCLKSNMACLHFGYNNTEDFKSYVVHMHNHARRVFSPKELTEVRTWMINYIRWFTQKEDTCVDM